MKMICQIILLSTFLVWYGFTAEFSRKGSIVLDDLLEDDHGEFELSDIIALAMSTVDVSEDSITPEERQKHVDIHNVLRMNYTYPIPEASNMNMVEHNNTLEWTAGEFLKYCTFDHFLAENDNMSHADYGQNMYRGPIRDVSRPIWNYYHVEYPWWYFNNNTCWEPSTKYQCGHFIQVMWAITKHIGFARKSNCFPRLRHRKWFIASHYLPGGLYDRPTEFFCHYGSPCSMCDSGFHCSNGLCIPDPERFCKAYNLDCECKLACKNCATPDYKNCKCNECKAGWDFSDCSFPCINYGEMLLSNVNCRRWACGKFDPVHVNFVAQLDCRKRCNQCRPFTESTKPDETCCGKTCDPYYVLDVETCECTLRCPSFLCLYPPKTTTTTTTTTTTSTTTSTSTTTTTTTTTASPSTTTTTTTTAPPTTISSITSPKLPIGKEPQPDVVSIAFKVLPKSMTNIWLIFIVFVTS